MIGRPVCLAIPTNLSPDAAQFGRAESIARRYNCIGHEQQLLRPLKVARSHQAAAYTQWPRVLFCGQTGNCCLWPAAHLHRAPGLSLWFRWPQSLCTRLAGLAAPPTGKGRGRAGREQTARQTGSGRSEREGGGGRTRAGAGAGARTIRSVANLIVRGSGQTAC